jgi:hypothetical protein
VINFASRAALWQALQSREKLFCEIIERCRRLHRDNGSQLGKSKGGQEGYGKRSYNPGPHVGRCAGTACIDIGCLELVSHP